MNRQIRLKSRPEGMPSADNFEIVDAPMPPVSDLVEYKLFGRKR